MGGGENVNGLVISNICPSLLLLNGHCAFNYIICQKPFKSNPKEPRYPEKRGLPNFGICAGSIEILWCNLFNLSQLIKTFEMALLGLPSALEPLCAPLNFFLENSHKLDQVINTDYSFILLINLLISWVTEWLRCKCFTITIILSWALFFCKLFANCRNVQLFESCWSRQISAEFPDSFMQVLKLLFQICIWHFRQVVLELIVLVQFFLQIIVRNCSFFDANFA